MIHRQHVLGIARPVESEVPAIDFGALVHKVKEARRDDLVVDFARVLCPHYGKEVEYVSRKEGSQIVAHNNKALYVEAIDIWCRRRLGAAQDFGSGGRKITDPKEAVAWAMEPWYAAMALEDPSRYRGSRRGAPPVYVGSPEDAVAFQLGIAAALDITPMSFVIGGRNEGDVEIPERIWARIYADRTPYDSDINLAGAAIGDKAEFPVEQAVEVPL